MKNRLFRLLLLVFLGGTGALSHAAYEYDFFEPGWPGLSWEDQAGFHSLSDAMSEPRLSSVDHPTTGTGILKVGEDGDTGGIHLVLAGEKGRDMTVRAWVFCEGNEGPDKKAGYQSLVARASLDLTQNFIRLSWDPDHSETGDSGDGWVKFQAFDGVTWDYMGIDFSRFGSENKGYILNGTSWESGWHLFRLDVTGDHTAAFVDNMTTPVVEGILSTLLRDGQGGTYVYSSGDYAGYFDDYAVDVQPTPIPPPVDFDILILNGEVFPGGNADSRRVDVGIRGDTIAAMEPDLSGKTAARVIHADGMTVTPGFIDAHTHADGGGALAAYIRQGVTTVVTGNCGGSPSIHDVASYYQSLEGKLGPNYIGLLGHNSLRNAVGLSGTTPTLSQMNAMKELIQQGMNAGAFGMSTGLIYKPGYNSTTGELIELAGVVAHHGGVYATHMRSEAEAVLQAVDEAVRIGRESGCRVQISHAKCAGPSAWGLATAFLENVDRATSEGVTVCMDQYPYTASQTTLNVLFPGWALDDWSDAVTNRRKELEDAVRSLIAGRGGAGRIYIISGTRAGKYLSEVSDELGISPELVMIDVIGPNGGSAVYHQMQEGDVRTFIVHDLVMGGSDGPTSSHPRGAGTFPRIWGHYGRDQSLFGKRAAVQKTSTLAAIQFRLIEQKRGLLEPGFYADLVIFDHSAILDRATWDQPTLSPTGIFWVIVNGGIVIDDGVYRSLKSGRVLRLNARPGGTSWILN